MEGDAATHLYVVATGAVKTTRLAADGRESLIDLLTLAIFLAPAGAGAKHYADSATTLTPPACSDSMHPNTMP